MTDLREKLKTLDDMPCDGDEADGGLCVAWCRNLADRAASPTFCVCLPIYRDYLALLAGEWISVDDESPEFLDEVWVVVDGRVMEGGYTDMTGWIEWDARGYNSSLKGVTHWQHIRKPAPPKEG